MAKPKIKVKKTFDFGKLSRMFPEIISDGLNEKAKWINRGIQEGLDSGVDIHGKQFEELTDNTKRIRKERGQPTGPPLVATGKMRKTKIDKASATKIETSIIAKTSYGAEHNDPAAFGKSFPKREWFGIPKASKRGGKDAIKVNVYLAKKLRRAWKKHGI